MNFRQLRDLKERIEMIRLNKRYEMNQRIDIIKELESLPPEERKKRQDLIDELKEQDKVSWVGIANLNALVGILDSCILECDKTKQSNKTILSHGAEIKQELTEIKNVCSQEVRESKIEGIELTLDETEVKDPADGAIIMKITKGFEKKTGTSGEREQVLNETMIFSGKPAKKENCLFYSRKERKLGYDCIIKTNESGQTIKEIVRNEDKDILRFEEIDQENGTRIGEDRPVFDKKRNLIGKFHQRISQNTEITGKVNSPSILNAYSQRSIVTDRTTLPKEGKVQVFRSITDDSGDGIIHRKDYVFEMEEKEYERNMKLGKLSLPENAIMVTEAEVNEKRGEMSITQYKDGKILSFELLDDPMTIKPDYIEDQRGFIEHTEVPQELYDVIWNEDYTYLSLRLHDLSPQTELTVKNYPQLKAIRRDNSKEIE